MGTGPRRRRRRLALITAGALLEPLLLLLKGLPLGGRDVVVRCRSGHLFSTIWIPSASLKAVRLGWLRLQWCPVGRHWTLVQPVKPSELGSRQLRKARDHHDVRIP